MNPDRRTKILHWIAFLLPAISPVPIAFAILGLLSLSQPQHVYVPPGIFAGWWMHYFAIVWGSLLLGCDAWLACAYLHKHGWTGAGLATMTLVATPGLVLTHATAVAVLYALPGMVLTLFHR